MNNIADRYITQVYNKIDKLIIDIHIDEYQWSIIKNQIHHFCHEKIKDDFFTNIYLALARYDYIMTPFTWQLEYKFDLILNWTNYVINNSSNHRINILLCSYILDDIPDAFDLAINYYYI